MALVAEGIDWLLKGLSAVEGDRLMLAALEKNPPSLITPPALLAVGKAAPAMLLGALAWLDARGGQSDQVLGISKQGHWQPWQAALTQLAPQAQLLEGDHPLPGAASVTAGETLVDWVNGLPAHQPVWVLISGGASALVEWLASGVTLEQWRALNDWLLASGWPIERVNRVRAQFSRLKGGGLARLLSPRPVQAWVLSDVPGNDLDVIASAPLRPMPPPAESDWAALPDALRGNREIQKQACPTVPHVLVGDNARWLQSVQQASAGAIQQVEGSFSGPVEALVQRLVQADAPLLMGGETTVSLPPRHGEGGRNQHLVLWMAQLLADTDGWCVALGSDGSDGPTPSAGGWADGRTLERLRQQGVDPEQALTRFDSHTALRAIGQTLETGPTGTNVMDAVLYWPPSTASMRARVRASAPC